MFLAVRRARACAVPLGLARRLSGGAVAHKIAFITDVEGNLTFWERQVRQSRCLRREHNGELHLNSGCSLVFGGDCFDKGPGNMRISQELVGLKQRYPDRVFLLLGNRDVNKMRFASELHASDLARDPASIARDFWLPPAALSFKDWLNEISTSHPAHSPQPRRERLAHLSPRALKLRYMLGRTMGAPKMLAFAQEELAVLRGSEHVSVEDAAEFLYEAIQPGGFIHQYISLGQLAVCIGDTLFVHGAVTALNAGFVPSPDTRCAMHRVQGHETSATHSVQQWVGLLNEWKDGQWSEFNCDPTWNLERTRRGGEGLMGYAYRKAMQQRTTMVANFFNEESECPWQGNLKPIDPMVEAYLASSGIARVVVGHKPFGDSPSFIRSERLEVINADTSFSDPKSPDNRGIASSELCIEQPAGAPSRSLVRGSLADGRAIEFDMSAVGQPSVIGRPVPGEALPGCFWVKARLRDAPKTFVTIRGQGFRVDSGVFYS